MFSTYTQDNTTQFFMLKLCQPYRKTLKGQKELSYLGPSLWNKIDTECKLIANLNTFKHSLKKSFFDQLMKNEEIYRYFRELSVVYYMSSLCCLYRCFSPCNDFLFLCKDHYENKVVKRVLCHPCQYHLVNVNVYFILAKLYLLTICKNYKF